MWSLRPPPPAAVRAFLERQASLPFSYTPVGATREARRRETLARAAPGYDADHNRVRVGAGGAAFERTAAALRRWEMFPAPWTRVLPHDGAAPAPWREGDTVAVLIRALGLWWLSSARIVYTLDETDGEGSGVRRRFGFAYGTLPGHVERGEERFTVEQLADGSVWYDLLAFSRPRHWAARVGYPLARRLQRRFVRGSQAAMRRAAERE